MERKKQDDINPDEAILKELRSHEVIADLDKKFGVKRGIGGQNHSANEQIPSIMPPEVWREIVQRKNDMLESLKRFSKGKYKVSNEEVQKLARVAQIVDVFIKEHGDRKNNPQERQILPSDNDALHRLIAILDNLTIWSAKFSTECSGGAGPTVPIQDYNPDTDSIYYTTPSGVTMRLKVVELGDGLQSVVQPFTEKSLFFGPNNEISSQPRKGYTVEEYFSPSFTSAVKNGSPESYKPTLNVYNEGNSIKVISHAMDNGEESFESDHNGDRINKIFFIK